MQNKRKQNIGRQRIRVNRKTVAFDEIHHVRKEIFNHFYAWKHILYLQFNDQNLSVYFENTWTIFLISCQSCCFYKKEEKKGRRKILYYNFFNCKSAGSHEKSSFGNLHRKISQIEKFRVRNVKSRSRESKQLESLIFGKRLFPLPMWAVAAENWDYLK